MSFAPTLPVLSALARGDVAVSPIKLPDALREPTGVDRVPTTGSRTSTTRREARSRAARKPAETERRGGCR
jgi:hypothetical protein